MRKTIFNLKLKDIVNIEDELNKISYYKQFVGGFLFSAICLFFALLIFIGYSIFSNISDSVEVISLIIIFTGFSIVSQIFWYKRLDLIKEYYELKQEKEKE